jgi:hypothetical protein
VRPTIDVTIDASVDQTDARKWPGTELPFSNIIL